MTGFLTVEDINTAKNTNGNKTIYHKIDTSFISEISDFSNVKYDFCEVSRSTSGSNITYSFKITIDSWNGRYYFTKKNGDYINASGSYSSGSKTLSFTTTETSVVLILCCNDCYAEVGDYPFAINRMPFIESEINPDLKVYLNEIGNRVRYNWINLNTGATSQMLITLNRGFNREVNNGSTFFYTVKLLKTDFQFNCSQSVIIGKVNKVHLGTNSDYLPNGDLVGNYTLAITVDYNGETLPVSYDGTDYYFNLDLTDKTETGKVRFTVNVESNEVLNSTSTNVALNSQYQTVNTFNALLTAVTNSDVIRLGANMTATSNININKSIKIIGNDKTIDLDSHRFVLKEDVEFKVENLQLDNGDTTIIQAKNTIVNLTGVIFNNCTSTNYNGLGSCIFCDVDVDSLDNTEDYTTTLTECTFTNNANCILHGGQLTIKGCTLDNNSITNINTNNPTFIYQTDGTCLIQQSAFDIDYDYSSTEANIGYAQALIMCGETANINGATHTDLQTDNILPFFEAPFNNRANLYAKYYYPQITDNVESVSTVSGKACCHACSGVDWVFKNNVTVRRVE